VSANPRFFAELERRNVPRAAVLYAGAVWAFGQGLSAFSPALGLPGWATRWFLVAAVIAFPFWLVFAWVYEFTPTGLKRESQIDPAQSIARSTAKKFDRWIIAVLAVAVVLLVTNQFVLRRDATSAADTADANAVARALAMAPAKSIPVFPEAHENGDPKQQNFSGGLSEELISDLPEINGPTVIGKYSSFRFRNSNDSPAQIGAALGVANLIEGSVRQEGGRIRVMVELIRAVDGSNVWSHTYDRQVKDVFAIQSEIGHAVAQALQVRLLGNAIVSDDRPPGGNIEVYQLMLQGRALARRATEAGNRQGIALLQQALRLDPNYAYAWGILSITLVDLGQTFLAGDARQKVLAQGRVAADKEQTLAPEAAATHFIRGYLLTTVDGDSVGALAEYRRALALAPNDGVTMNFLAGGLQVVGQLQPAVELYRKAIATDPLRVDWYSDLADALLGQGELDAAEKVARQALVLQPDYPGLFAQLAAIQILRGNVAAALDDARKETDPKQRAWALVLAKQIGPDRKDADVALRDYLAGEGKTEPSYVADLYALRKQPDEMFDWLERARTQHDPNFYALLSDPFVLVWRRDPRFGVLCRNAGLPPPGQVLPQGSP